MDCLTWSKTVGKDFRAAKGESASTLNQRAGRSSHRVFSDKMLKRIRSEEIRRSRTRRSNRIVLRICKDSRSLTLIAFCITFCGCCAKKYQAHQMRWRLRCSSSSSRLSSWSSKKGFNIFRASRWNAWRFLRLSAKFSVESLHEFGLIPTAEAASSTLVLSFVLPRREFVIMQSVAWPKKLDRVRVCSLNAFRNALYLPV